MKFNWKKCLAGILCIVGFLLILVKVNQFEKATLVSTTGQSYEKAVVTEITKDNLAEDGNRYGTLKADILTLLEQGKNVVMDIDVQGAGQVRSCREGILPLCYADVYIYVPQAELKNRLCGRQTDGAETIALRLRNAEQEDACLPQYRYCLVSSDRETDYASFCALLKCQSMRVGLMR